MTEAIIERRLFQGLNPNTRRRRRRRDSTVELNMCIEHVYTHYSPVELQTLLLLYLFPSRVFSVFIVRDRLKYVVVSVKSRLQVLCGCPVCLCVSGSLCVVVQQA